LGLKPFVIVVVLVNNNDVMNKADMQPLFFLSHVPFLVQGRSAIGGSMKALEKL
jgi:hypothetical protein